MQKRIKSQKRYEHYDVTLSVADNLAIIKQKYDILLGLFNDDLFKPANNYISIIPGNKDLWEQVPVYRAYDNSWYLENKPSCPANYYGSDCDILCEPAMGCVGTETDAQLNERISSFRANQCADTSNPDNAKYCKNYLDWNPNNRNVLFAARAKRFADQAEAHRKFLDDKKIAHEARIKELDGLLINAKASIETIQTKYTTEFNAIVADIASINAEIEDSTQRLKQLREDAVAARIAAINATHSATMTQLGNDLSTANATLANIMQEIAALQQKITDDGAYAAGLEKEYNRLQAIKDAANAPVPIGPVPVPTKAPVTGATTTKPAGAGTIPAPIAPVNQPKIKDPPTVSILEKIKSCNIL